VSKLIKITMGLVAATALGATAQAGCPVVTKTTCVTCVVTPPPPSCVKCDGPRTGTSSLPPLSSYFEHQARCGTTTPTYRPLATSYSGASAHAGASSAGSTASASSHAAASSAGASSYARASAYAGGGVSQASAYASASSGAHATATARASSYASTTNHAPVVTSTYHGHQYRYEGFSGTYSGLGHNERLHPTRCPVAVHNPQHHQVAGCYKVVKQWTPPKIHQPAPHRVFYRVVRPVIYVRYPVPVCVTGPCAPQPYQRSRYGS
jgi:hypothetical protein